MRVARFVFRIRRLFSPPEAAFADVLDYLRSIVRFRPVHLQARTSLVEAPLRFTSTNDRFGCGTRDCALRLAYAFHRHRSCVTVSVRSGFPCGYKLFMTATLQLTPPPLRCRGVGTLPLRCHSATSLVFPALDAWPLRSLILYDALNITVSRFSHP